MYTKALYNRLPGLQIVSNKMRLAYIFRMYERLYEAAFNFAPQTFCLPYDKEKLQSYMRKKRISFIAKPQGGSEGAGIFLVKTYRDLPSYAF